MIFAELLVTHSHMPNLTIFTCHCYFTFFHHMSMTMLLETNIFFSTIPYEKMRSWLSLFYDLFLISSDNILLPAFRLQLACAQGGHVTVKSFGRLFPVSWLCFTQAFSTPPSKNILCSYVLYPHRCFSPLQLYYPLRLSPSLKTRRRRAAGVGGWSPLFYDVSIPFF